MKNIFIEIINIIKIILTKITKAIIYLFKKESTKTENDIKKNEKNQNVSKQQKYIHNNETSLPDTEQTTIFSKKTQDELDILIIKTIEEFYCFKIENVKEKEQKEEIQKRTADIKPLLNKNYSKNTNKNTITDQLIKKEQEKPLFPKKHIDKKTEIKEVTPLENTKNHTINTNQKTKLKLKEKPQSIKKETAKIKETKTITQNNKQINNHKITNETKNYLSLKNEVTNVILTSSIVLANIAENLIKETPKKEEKQTQKKENKINKPEPKISNHPPTEQKNIPLENTDKQNEELKLPTTEIEKEIQTQDYNLETEENNEKKYQELKNKINESLQKIEYFTIQNESKLTTKQKDILQNEKNKLNNLKETLSINEQKKLNEEKEILEQNIQETEIKGLKEKIQKMNIEHQIDLQELQIKKAEDLNKKTKQELSVLEKKLTKKKLKKAFKIAEISSIFSFPFIRNKYFFYFTTGLFINNHFRFLSKTLNHQSNTAYLPDTENLKRGKNALDAALNMTIDNLNCLEHIKKQTITKYPELKKDSEFMVYIRNLEMRLQYNYDRLIKKQETIEQHIYKTNKKKRILKRKKYPFYYS